MASTLGMSRSAFHPVRQRLQGRASTTIRGWRQTPGHFPARRRRCLGQPIPGARWLPSPSLLASTAMTDQSSVAGAEPVKVGLGWSNVVVTVFLLGFLGWVVWALARGAFTFTDTPPPGVNA